MKAVKIFIHVFVISVLTVPLIPLAIIAKIHVMAHNAVGKLSDILGNWVDY